MPTTVSLDSADLGILVLLFLLCGILAVPAGLALRWWYRRAVLSAMLRSAREEAAPADAFAARPTTAGPPPPPPALRIEVLHAEEPAAADAEAAALFGLAARARWSLALVYALAGAAYTACALLIYHYALPWEGKVDEMGRLFVSLSLLWPMVPVVAAVGVARGASQLLAPAVYFLLMFIILTAILPATLYPAELTLDLNDPELTRMSVVLAPVGLQPRALAGLILFIVFLFVWPFIVFVPTVMFVAFQYLRAVGIVVGFTMVLLLLGMAAGMMLTKAGLEGWWLAAAWLLVFAAEAAAAWLLVKLLARRYAGKKMSDQSVVIDSYWLAVSVCMGLLVGSGYGLWLAALFLLPFVVYKLVLWAALGLRRRRAARAPDIRLLLLRVFSNRRTRGLLEDLGRFWRYVGSIQLIAGADLATSNVELHEFLDFVSRRLRDRFIKDSADLAGQVEAIDFRPDPDGRYRVNEFFCYDDTWRETLVELVERSDAVLMDLRGFTPQNEGCVFELRQLLNIVPAGRLVLTTDRRTDFDFLYATLRDAWNGMDDDSPNRAASRPVLRILYAPEQSSRAVRRLLSLLFEAAQSARRAAPPQVEPA